MSKFDSGLKAEESARSTDRKVAFDAGYSSYEDGNDEYDFKRVSESLIEYPGYTAMWRFGWQRAREDSTWSRRSVRFN